MLCEIYVTLTGLFAGGLGYIFGHQLLGIYSTDSEVIAAGFIRLTYVCRVYFLCGIMDVLVGSLRGMGTSVLPMIVSLLGAGAFRLVWIATIFKSNHTLMILYLSYPVSWILTATVHFLTFLFIYSKLKRASAQN